MPETMPAGDADSARVSNLELFFDLVFVFTVTQITEVVDRHPDASGIGQGLLLLVVLYWMYGGFSWLTNAMGTEGARQRVTVLAGMAALFVCSQAVPEAFGDAGVVIGVGYLRLTLLHLAGFRWLSGGRATGAALRLAPLNLAGALMVLAAGWTHGLADWLLWGGAAALFLGELIRTSVSGRFTLQPTHFAERHGLTVMIVLGESVISVALAAREQRLDLRLIAGCLLGVAAVAAMWWAYFVGDNDEAAAQLKAAPARLRPRMATVGYDLSHMAMIAGVIGVAAGIRLGLADLLAPATTVAGWLIGGGAAIFLAATALFRWRLGFASPVPRLIGAAVVLATVPVGHLVGSAQQLGVIALVIAMMIAADRAHRRAKEPRPGG